MGSNQMQKTDNIPEQIGRVKARYKGREPRRRVQGQIGKALGRRECPTIYGKDSCPKVNEGCTECEKQQQLDDHCDALMIS